MSPERGRLHPSAIIASLLGLIALPLCAHAQVVQLANGGQLEAAVNHDSQVAAGGQVELVVEGVGSVVLASHQVQQVESPKVTEDEYFDHAANFTDTIGDQWKLAKWCQQQGLQLPFQRHARRVLELDPNYLPARKALGYERRDGQWVSREEIMTDRGYIRFEGRWTTMQQAALQVAQTQHKQKVIDWKVRLHRWRQQLGRSSSPEIQIDLETLDDPDAIPGLIQLLGNEHDQDLAFAYLETLGRMNSPAARSFLMENAVFQNNPIYREKCLQEVLAQRNPNMVAFFANHLKSYDNTIVLRAAYVLAQLDYPTAVFPLAGALQTQHLALHSSRYTYFYTSLAPENGFDIDGPKASYRMLTLSEFLGRSRNAYDIVRVQNHGVHLALIKLCEGQDFGYNPAAWKEWYQQVHAPKSPTIRLAREE
ncbi:HEAT repeat domain-containing protein [Bremerella alba]|uniref:HEAT repeat domain-containing protein n=1 Tax=Bremerella alba TaxID=980252 RepID=UPI001A95519E|nr:HEAT repeat domain-containing protein [Bremerella alba]